MFSLQIFAVNAPKEYQIKSDRKGICVKLLTFFLRRSVWYKAGKVDRFVLVRCEVRDVVEKSKQNSPNSKA